MTQLVPLSPISNQSFSINLDDVRYEFRLRNIADSMVLDLSIEDETILQGHRLLADTPIIPYEYLEMSGGNFVMITEVGDIPIFSQFGVTQFMLYFSIAELEVIRGD